ncbi:hypothetical protein ON010_g8727 [Phytophthora cinnamomi]|nr:hypothetical protein ON010_g8727 [Phytophthora cinnamomi]
MAKQLGQREIEQPLMAIDFVTNIELDQRHKYDAAESTSNYVTNGVSYKGVVNGVNPAERKFPVNVYSDTEMQKLYNICTTPA